MKGKIKLLLLYIFSFLSCTVPLIAVFAMRSDRYIHSAQDVIRLSVGGGLCAFFLILKVVGKLRMPRRIVVYAFVLILVYLMEPVIADLKILCLAALVGELLDYIIFQPWIRREREKQLIDKTATASASATRDAIREELEDMMKNYGGGRT